MVSYPLYLVPQSSSFLGTAVNILFLAEMLFTLWSCEQDQMAEFECGLG